MVIQWWTEHGVIAVKALYPPPLLILRYCAGVALPYRYILPKPAAFHEISRNLWEGDCSQGANIIISRSNGIGYLG